MAIEKCTMFGGEDAEAQNVLMTALYIGADGKDDVYSFMHDTPKTSFVVELYDALKSQGYKIIKE